MGEPNWGDGAASRRLFVQRVKSHESPSSISTGSMIIFEHHSSRTRTCVGSVISVSSRTRDTIIVTGIATIAVGTVWPRAAGAAVPISAVRVRAGMLAWGDGKDRIRILSSPVGCAFDLRVGRRWDVALWWWPAVAFVIGDRALF